MIFFALTVLRSRRAKIPAWRSSSLAVLQALDPKIRSQLGGGMRRVSEVEGMVGGEGVEVVLRGRGGRWELG